MFKCKLNNFKKYDYILYFLFIQLIFNRMINFFIIRGVNSKIFDK